jgi:hypothetical protein
MALVSFLHTELQAVCLQVSGEINLACCWRVTPQDVLTLRVRTLAAEVSQREEVLAVLAERSGQEVSQSSLAGTSAASPEAQLRGGPSASDLKTARTSRGRLGVKVSVLEKPRAVIDNLKALSCRLSAKVWCCHSTALHLISMNYIRDCVLILEDT